MAYGDRNIIQEYFSGVFKGRYAEGYTKHRWIIECADGKHTVTVSLGSTARSTKNIYIDGEHTAMIPYKGKGIIPFQTYDFQCGGDRITLVFYANKVDIVHNGVLKSNNLKWKSTPKSSMLLNVFLSMIALVSLSVTLIYSFQIDFFWCKVLGLLTGGISSLCCAVFVLSSAGNPLLSMRKKFISIAVAISLAWILQFIVVYVMITIIAM